MGPNPTRLVSLKEGLIKGCDHRHTGRMPCEETQAEDSHQRAKEREAPGLHSSSLPSERTNLADTLLLDF